MLYLDAAIEVDNLTIYRDYNDKARFYYLPSSPRVAMDGGQPMFQLLLYRDVAETEEDSSAGGFLTMTTDLAVSSSRLQQAGRELSSRFGVQAFLAPLPVKSGTVRVTALDSAATGGESGAEPRFVESLIASGTPSLYGDQRAVFSAELSRKGAALMKAAIEGDGAVPVVLIYEFQYDGLLPAYDVNIKIQFEQAYQHLRTRTQMNTLWFRADIDNEIEKLIKSGAVDIEEVVYQTETPTEASARMAALNTLAKDLAQWAFFTPGLSPGTVLAVDRGTLEAYDATAAATNITSGLTSQAAAALTGVGATEDVGAPRRPGSAVATGAVEEAEEGATSEGPTEEASPGGQAGGDDEPTTPGEQPAASGGPPTAVEAWNRAGRPQGAYLLRSLSQTERQDIEYKLHQVSAVERSIAPQGQLRLLPGATDLPGRIVEADLDSEFFKVVEGVVTTRADLEELGVASIVVKIRYGLKPDGTRWKDQVEKVLSAPGDSHPYRFAMDSEGSREMEYQVILNYRPDTSIGDEVVREETEWIATTTRTLDINPLTHGSVIPVEVTAAMVDWESVQQIQVRVSYKDEQSGIEAADTKILNEQTPSGSVRIRPRNASLRDVTVVATFFGADGGQETVTSTHPGDEPFVLNQPADNRVVVDVRLADLLARYKRATVQLGDAAQDPPQVERTVNLGEETTEAQWSFRRDANANSFAYRVTAFLADGSIREEDWKTTDNPLLIVGDRAAGVLQVRAVMLGAPADGGFRLARLRLSYPDAPSWADSDIEHLFRDGTEELTWRVPMDRVDAKSYTYEITWFSTDGARTTTGPVTTSDEILLLDPLAPSDRHAPR